MTLYHRLVGSSIGKKQLVAITGLGLCAFLVGHLGGNLFIFVGQEAFDGYAHKLESNPLLIPAEIVLAAFFLAHIAFALLSNLQSRRARGEPYVCKGSRGAKNIANTTMVFSGIVVLIFVVLHLITFKFGERVSVTYENGEVVSDSLYWLVIKKFHSVPYVVWYVVANCILGLHVGHGFQSSFRTLGFYHSRYSPALFLLSVVFGVVVAVGYGAMPLYAFFCVEMPPEVMP